HPRRLFEVLSECGALARLLPELRPDETLYAALARAAQERAPLTVRFALLVWPLDEQAAGALCARLRAPNEVKELALATCRCREPIRGADRAGPAALLETLKRADALRRGERFGELLAVARFAEPGAPIALAIERLQGALEAARGVDAAALAKAAASPAEIPARLDRAREQAIAAALAQD
ncbi:MAG TPA: multifunctional CCA tRNA nucleotidyl transferase/2'3'-cyclic phosphodiesterase/2'nucleotidase/phosphatase, partial [Burkholderiales bacterium]|nr:multifunctional CCA tRNA nucleotidyl transferase/2'3'-cyclic phosphodiesterase/2'nucleotidase/phosphatase [Burkholderiales bacterium]